MVKNGEDWHGLQTTNLKNLSLTIQDAQTATELLYHIIIQIQYIILHNRHNTPSLSIIHLNTQSKNC